MNGDIEFFKGRSLWDGVPCMQKDPMDSAKEYITLGVTNINAIESKLEDCLRYGYTQSTIRDMQEFKKYHNSKWFRRLMGMSIEPYFEPTAKRKRMEHLLENTIESDSKYGFSSDNLDELVTALSAATKHGMYETVEEVIKFYGRYPCFIAAINADEIFNIYSIKKKNNSSKHDFEYRIDYSVTAIPHDLDEIIREYGKESVPVDFITEPYTRRFSLSFKDHSVDNQSDREHAVHLFTNMDENSFFTLKNFEKGEAMFYIVDLSLVEVRGIGLRFFGSGDVDFSINHEHRGTVISKKQIRRGHKYAYSSCFHEYD